MAAAKEAELDMAAEAEVAAAKGAEADAAADAKRVSIRLVHIETGHSGQLPVTELKDETMAVAAAISLAVSNIPLGGEGETRIELTADASIAAWAGVDNLNAQAKRKKVDAYPSQLMFVKLLSGDLLSLNVPFPSTTIEALGKCVEDRLTAFGTANTVFRFVWMGKEYRPRGEGKQMLLSQLNMCRECTVQALLESDPTAESDEESDPEVRGKL